MFETALKKIRSEGVRGVLLDLDNTLYEYDPCHRSAFEACSKKFRALFPSVSANGFKKLYAKAQRAVKHRIPTQAASHSRLLYFQTLLEEFSGTTDVRLALTLETLYWKSFFSKMKLRSGAFTFLRVLRGAHVRVCIVTDLTAHIQFEKLRKLKLDRYVDFVVSSEETGIEKPYPAVFQLALKKLQLRPSGVMMVGDDHGRDVRGAKKLGIRTVRIR